MPRERELACVYRAHCLPPFIEGALRAAVQHISRLWPVEAYDCVYGNCRSIESIRDYDLSAVMTFRPPRRPETATSR